MRFLAIVLLLTCMGCQPAPAPEPPALPEEPLAPSELAPEPPALEPNGVLTLIERGRYLAKFDGNLSNTRMSVRAVRMTNGFTQEQGSGVEFTIGRKGAEELLGSALFVDTELDELLQAIEFLLQFDQRATLDFAEAAYRVDDLSILGYQRANDQLGFIAALGRNSVLLTTEQPAKLAEDVRTAREQLESL